MYCKFNNSSAHAYMLPLCTSHVTFKPIIIGTKLFDSMI